MPRTSVTYGGTIDLLCEIGGLLELIDFKTTYSLLEMTCGVQLEAYSQALISHGITPQRKHILHLKKDGKWSFREFPAKDPARCRVVGALKCLYDYGHIFSCVWKRLCGSERPTFVPFVWVPRFWREMPPLPDGVQLNY